MNDDKINIITVIGNGFDLHLGLPTRYENFFNVYLGNAEKYVASQEGTIFGFYTFKNDIIYYCYKQSAYYDDVAFKINDWWSLYFLEHKIKKGNWCNIEEEIQKVFSFFHPNDKKRKLEKSDSMYEWIHSGTAINYGETITIYDLIRIQNKLYPRYNEDIFEYLLRELKKFENKFIGYLKHIQEDMDFKNKNYYLRFKRLFNSILKIVKKDYVSCNLKKNPEAPFKTYAMLIDIREKIEKEYENKKYNTCMSFNYFFSSGEVIDNFLNMHGRLKLKSDLIRNSEIIFGIDETAEVADGAEIFKKTHRKLFLKNYDNKSLPNTCDYIIFFGHSLAQADYSYFQSMFDLYDIYSSKIKLFFIVNSDVEDVPQKTNAVYKLIHDYGEKTHGEQKGGNLLHKLLLENRIRIIKITADPEKQASDIILFPEFPKVEEKTPEETEDENTVHS